MKTQPNPETASSVAATGTTADALKLAESVINKYVHEPLRTTLVQQLAVHCQQAIDHAVAAREAELKEAYERISWLEQQREEECKQKEAALRESEICLKETRELKAALATARAEVERLEKNEKVYFTASVQSAGTMDDLRQQLATANAALEQQAKDIQWVETRISCDDSGAELLKCRAALEQSAARTKELEEQVKRVIGNCREKIYVDASPDSELPARILSAYIEEIETVSYLASLGKLMNKWQAERNTIIRAAIELLARAAPAGTEGK